MKYCPIPMFCLAMLCLAPLTAATVSSSIDITFYGKAKVDAIYETRDMAGGIPKWVKNEENDDGNFYMTPRNTRLGLKLKGDAKNGITTKGQLEIDFYGGDTNSINDSNKPQPRLRHAYGEATWEDTGVSLLAGQYWELLSPELGSTVYAGAFWWSGDLGYRRSQIRLSKKMEIGQEGTLTEAGAVLGNTGNMDAEAPALQFSGIYGFPMNNKTAKISATAAINEDKDGAQAQVINLGFYYQFRKMSGLKVLFGPVRMLLISLVALGKMVPMAMRSQPTGGWLQAGIKTGDWKCHAGFGLDDPKDEDLADGGRGRSSTLTVNAFYNLTKQMTLAAECNRFVTDYIGGEERDSVRLQFASIYKF